MDRLSEHLTNQQIGDWFKIGKKVEVRTIPKFKLEGGRPVDPETKKPYTNAEIPFNPPYKRHGRINNPCQTAYGDHYKQLENEASQQQHNLYADDFSESASQVTGALEQIEIGSTYTASTRVPSILPNGVTEEEALGVYHSYPFEHQYDENLAITKHRKQIVDVIESNQVTIIEGETGSGKTTQVAQYILDHYRRENKYCNIVVTQPRRIAAVSIARRVCHERGWQLGNLCGYQIGLDNKTNLDTRITFCTTGVLLRKLVADKNMLEFTHVILDEVHERDQKSDFCLLVTKKLQRTNSKDVKIILMSATFDTNLFANYFALQVRGRLEPAPVYKVKGRSYQVREFFLEDLTALGTPQFKPDNPEISFEMYRLAAALVQKFDDLEVKKPNATGLPAKKGSVLIFLPGIVEIQDMDSVLRNLPGGSNLAILPLHSSITGEEQARVFDRIALGKRKVILSTNIAESSITVPDVEYVIDFCLTKCQVCDPDTNYTKLELQWASKANCTQRKGRAGRVSNGRIYHLVPRTFYEELFDYGIPEMQRSPLSHIILQVKRLDLGETKAILGLALSPPNLDDIEKTVLTLKEVGAMASLASGEVNPHDGDLTFLGRALADLPVDIHLGRLMMFGHVFGLLKETIIISAALSLKSFFSQPFNTYLEAYKHRMAWASDSFSDCIAYLNAFKTWMEHRDNGSFATHEDQAKWGKRHFIQIRRINEVRLLCIELEKKLKAENICIPQNVPSPDLDCPDTRLLLKLVICGAFYPSYFLLGKTDEDQVVRSLSGKNPFQSVMLKGFPSNQGILYKKNVEAFFKSFELRELPKIHFEETRAYVEFPRDIANRHENINTIVPAVYLAIKLRHLRIPLRIKPFPDHIIKEKIESIRQSKIHAATVKRQAKVRDDLRTEEGSDQVALPSPQHSICELNITEIVDCGHFWAHYGDEKTWSQLNRLQNNINLNGGRHLHPVDLETLKPGDVVLALFDLDVIENFYRARVETIHKRKVGVFYLDYGNTAEVHVSRLKRIEQEYLALPFQAMEMELCGIKPSVIKCPSGKWSTDAKNQFKNICDNSSGFVATVYSVVHGVVRVILKTKDSEKSINDMLVDLCFADRSEESLPSRQNHKLREEQQVLGESPRLSLSDPQSEVRLLSDAAAASRYQNYKSESGQIALSGPSSPLEFSFESMTAMGSQKTTKMQRDSVNSVALNDEPQCMYDRMMVAARVGLNPSGQSLMAYDTTLMPNVPGLPALMALTFTPIAELRTDSERTRYTGALCGLGWDPISGGPALPDHDMEISFDTVIDSQDIEMINKVRMAINLAIGAENSANWTRDGLLKIQNRAKETLLQLLKRRREPLEPTPCMRRYRWNLASPEFILHPCYEQGSHLLNLHPRIQLKDVEGEDSEEEEEEDDRVVDLHARRKEEMIQHIEFLRSKASRSRDPENIACQLCSTVLSNPFQLKLHLASMSHRDNVNALLH